MIESPFPGWSALQWRDIAPGAQTERRGGAGPVRGLLGGKASPAALLGVRGKTVGQHPCLPDTYPGLTLPSDLSRASTPSTSAQKPRHAPCSALGSAANVASARSESKAGVRCQSSNFLIAKARPEGVLLSCSNNVRS